MGQVGPTGKALPVIMLRDSMPVPEKFHTYIVSLSILFDVPFRGEKKEDKSIVFGVWCRFNLALRITPLAFEKNGWIIRTNPKTLAGFKN